MKKLFLLLLFFTVSIATVEAQGLESTPIKPVPIYTTDCVWVDGYWSWNVWGGIPYLVYIEGYESCTEEDMDTGGDPGDEDEGGPLTTQG